MPLYRITHGLRDDKTDLGSVVTTVVQRMHDEIGLNRP
jgi:hypothetical protein